MAPPKVSQPMRRAMEIIVSRGGSILTSSIPDRNDETIFGDVEPGIKVYEKLDRLGLIVLTEEDPINLGDGLLFTFTPSAEITDAGRIWLKLHP